MKRLVFTRVHLSNVRVTMAIIRVPLVELLCHTVIGWIPALEYLLPGAHGCL
jgi:hypothetical protein